MLELAGNAARDNKRFCYHCFFCYLQLAICNNEYLMMLLGGAMAGERRSSDDQASGGLLEEEK